MILRSYTILVCHAATEEPAVRIRDKVPCTAFDSLYTSHKVLRTCVAALIWICCLYSSRRRVSNDTPYCCPMCVASCYFLHQYYLSSHAIITSD